MSKTAQARFNAALGRWEATYQGKVLAKSSDPANGAEYLRKVIEGGFSNKAKAVGVNKLEIIGGPVVGSEVGVGAGSSGAEPEATIESEFSIDERFGIMSDYVDMVSKRQLASALVTGEGGLGKTFTVMSRLAKSGLKDISKMEIGARFDGQKGYIVIKGYSTAKGLYRTLYENRNQICIFDDCDSILKDPTAVNLLKAALDSYDERKVTWNAEGWGDEDLPKNFDFVGGVVFISNMAKEKIPQALRSRAVCVDVGMTRAEVVQRMRTIAMSPEFMKDIGEEEKMEALEFVAEHAYHPLVKQLNLRSLVKVINLRIGKPDSWKRSGLYAMASE